MRIGGSELALLVMLAVYAWFAWQLGHLLRAKRYGAFLLRLVLAPVILLFDWPMPRSRLRKP